MANAKQEFGTEDRKQKVIQQQPQFEFVAQVSRRTFRKRRSIAKDRCQEIVRKKGRQKVVRQKIFSEEVFRKEVSGEEVQLVAFKRIVTQREVGLEIFGLVPIRWL